MNQFSRTLAGWRFVETLANDTMQGIAARELGDASRWVDLVNINGLTPPYLTGNSSQAGPTVKLFGQLILVPASTPQVSAQTDPDAVYGTDCQLFDGDLQPTDGGDFATVAGRANLRQAIVGRIATDPGELLFHLDYGCAIRKLLGKANGPTSELLAGKYVAGALLSDPRVKFVSSAIVQVTGDVLAVDATIVPIAGAPINVSAGG
jgi:phage baseplate assembly protein W